MKNLLMFFLLLIGLSSCHYPRGEDDLSPLKKNTNLEVYSDSVKLECLPIKNSYIILSQGASVVVAELAIHPKDSVDSVWVKVAHSQEVQGWIRQKDLIHSFVPTDSISQFIHLFSATHASYFLIVFTVFVGFWLFRVFRKRQLQLVYFNDIESVYPLFLCLLMAFSATIYETMQVFVPETWEYYYFNPTLSPFKTPFILSVFLLSIWLFVIVTLAVLDDLFRQLTPGAALFYLLGLTSCCIFCYFFFILTTHFYIGYLFLLCFGWICMKRMRHSMGFKYRCGQCGRKLKDKGTCPYCGAINE